MPWTDDQVAELRRLWLAGATGGEIARALKTTKNAAVGKAHRLGLATRPSPIVPAATEKKPQRKRSKPSAVQEATAPRPRTQAEAHAQRSPEREERRRDRIRQGHAERRRRPSGSTVRQATSSPFRTCQWIAGEPSADAPKCGAPTVNKSSYCEAHYERAYTRVKYEPADGSEAA